MYSAHESFLSMHMCHRGEEAQCVGGGAVIVGSGSVGDTGCLAPHLIF